MSNVTLELGGRSYAVACADGQEAHILGLGRAIDAKLATMPNLAAQSEARTLLFAALLMADECHETKQNQTKPAAPADPGLAEALEKLAGRLESCAARLENGAGTP
jgi:cell division protein ZapA